MEGLFQTEQGASIVILGQPDVSTQTIDNAISIPQVLGVLTYRRWNAEVQGLDAFPREQWPDAIPLLFYSYHIMVGLGTSRAAGHSGCSCWPPHFPSSPISPAGLRLSSDGSRGLCTGYCTLRMASPHC
jgi:hypothetical protein